MAKGRHESLYQVHKKISSFCLLIFPSLCLVFLKIATEYYSLSLAPSHIKSALYRVITDFQGAQRYHSLGFLTVQDLSSCESSKVKQNCK